MNCPNCKAVGTLRVYKGSPVYVGCASITRRVQGLETLAHFGILDGNLDGGTCCVGCSTHLWDRVTPVELSDGGEVDQDATGDCSPLCRECSFLVPARIKAAWPSGLTVAEVSAIWVAVNAEQARELECQLERDRATALDELQRASAAVEQSQIDKELREAHEALRILEAAQAARRRASAPLASVLPGGRVISGGRQ